MNREGAPGHDPGLQRHHILPCQLRGRHGIGRLLDPQNGVCMRFDDFRANGLLLPCVEATAIRLALPLHRGPHPRYTELVAERVGRIEQVWSASRARTPALASDTARWRLGLLQTALRRFLLEGARKNVRLNRFDPAWKGVDFSELDAMADVLWTVTEPAAEAGQR